MCELGILKAFQRIMSCIAHVVGPHGDLKDKLNK